MGGGFLLGLLHAEARIAVEGVCDQPLGNKRNQHRKKSSNGTSLGVREAYAWQETVVEGHMKHIYGHSRT